MAKNSAAEARLLYTYMARLSALSGDHAGAVEYLRKKAAVYPDLPADTEQVGVLVDQAVVWTQIGRHEASRGDPVAAARAYEEAVAFEARAGNLEGEVQAAASLGRAALRVAALAERPEPAGDLLNNAAAIHRRLIGRLDQENEARFASASAGLTANLAQLLDAGAQTAGDNS